VNTTTITTPAIYVMPKDGYDICESCNYLEPVAATTSADGIEPMRALCQSCAIDLGEIDNNTKEIS